MTDLFEQKFQATPMLAAIVYEGVGLQAAFDSVEALQKRFGSVPGIELAYQTLRALLAENRSQLGQSVLRAAAKAGIAIADAPGLYTRVESSGEVFITTGGTLPAKASDTEA